MVYYKCGTPVTIGSEFLGLIDKFPRKIVYIDAKVIKYEGPLKEVYEVGYHPNTKLRVSCHKTNTIKINHNDLWE